MVGVIGSGIGELDGRCPTCEYQHLKAWIEKRGLNAVLRPKPMKKFSSGQDLFAVRSGKVIGEWIRWFPTPPTGPCTCKIRRPLLNRDTPPEHE